MELDFFFSTDSGLEALTITVWLSALTTAGPSNGTLIILNLNRNPSIVSVATFMAVNSEPKLLVSIESCFREIQTIGALLRNINTPVRDLLVNVSPA